MRITSMFLGLGLLWVLPASAQDIPPVSGALMGMESVERGVQGPAGLLHSRVLLHLNMSANQASDPISLAPDLYYSFTDTVQLGLVHNLRGIAQAQERRNFLHLCIRSHCHDL